MYNELMYGKYDNDRMLLWLKTNVGDGTACLVGRVYEPTYERMFGWASGVHFCVVNFLCAGNVWAIDLLPRGDDLFLLIFRRRECSLEDLEEEESSSREVVRRSLLRAGISTIEMHEIENVTYRMQRNNKLYARCVVPLFDVCKNGHVGLEKIKSGLLAIISGAKASK